jgi:ATP-dependent DNA helicase RecG
MNQKDIQNYLMSDVKILSGVGPKVKTLLRKKKIEKISDLLWNFPRDFIDRSNIKTLNQLKVGEVNTIKVKVLKYNFPRIRNLPSKVKCVDETGEIEIVFFNSKEGYIRKILPLDNHIVISGKIGFFKKKYQITNPTYVVPLDKQSLIDKTMAQYSLTEGLNEKTYRKLVETVLQKILNLKEWHETDILKKIGNVNLSKSLSLLHSKNNNEFNSNYYRRIAYDEILANLLVLSQARKIVKKSKKKKKIFNNVSYEKITNNLNYSLTNHQKKAINEINKDLESENKMLRILQGDVGSGKTIVSLICAANTISSNYQSGLMAPTEILCKQHFELAKKIFEPLGVNVEILTGKTKTALKKEIYKKLENGEIDLLVGTHAIFQKNVMFKNLGLIIIDEQHKFGVKQRIQLSEKGGLNCDILLMSATPIPRTLVMTVYGDMDVSRIEEKPLNRKDILTLSKPEEKIDEILNFIKKEIKNKKQVFWVCPLIEESKNFDYTAAVKKFKLLSNQFKDKVGLIHGALSQEEKNIVLNKFLNNKISILVATTVIEVGIDFPNANVIVVENSNKFGLSQLHQLRGRVGRGSIQATCILLFKKNLSENARKRIKILKSTNNGFIIAEEDMKLRGFGDIVGYQQSGIKNFKIADPVHHQDLFEIANLNIKDIETNEKNFSKYEFLIKLFDKADIINEISYEKTILD